MTRSIIYKIFRLKWLQHLLFWVLSFYTLARLFSDSNQVSKVDWVYTVLFHFSLFFVVYINIRFLISALLKKHKYLLYFLFSLLLVLSGIFLNFITYEWLGGILFPDFYFISYYEFWDIFEFMSVYFAISSLLKFSKGWFENIETERNLNLLKHQKLSTELDALKTQINPHFLFNNLNNLYTLSLDNDKKVPEIILRIANMMRYMLYETNAILVPLEKEVEYIKDFIKMEQLRIGKQTSIQFKINGQIGNNEIAPLLFLPLIENGFKHGIKGETAHTFIHIQLDILEKELVFKVKNNRGSIDGISQNKSGGVGLKNLKRRLELLYPNSHNIEIIKDVNVFVVILKIDII